MVNVPLSGTNIRLLSGVPFSNDYKNSKWFDNLSSQTTYFTGRTIVHSMVETTFQRLEGYNYIAVNESIDFLHGTNYVMFQNADYNNKWFYAFVTKLEYRQSKTTWVHIQLDVLQTWRFEMNFKPSFVMREHCKLWNSDGSPVVNTIDEGLAYGTDYDTVSVENFIPYEEFHYLVIVAKATLHDAGNVIKASINGAPQPLCYYVHPFRVNATSPDISDGTSFGLSNTILQVLEAMATQDNAVNNIVSMYVTDYIGVNPSYDSGLDRITFNGNSFAVVSIGGVIQTLYVKKLASYGFAQKDYANKYLDYSPVTESKLMMFPYTVLMMDDFKGNRVTFKNEYINSSDLKITVRGSIGTSNKVSYGITDYLTDNLSNIAHKMVMSLENSLINNNPSDIPILSDFLSAYLQGNRNSILNQQATAVFNGVIGSVGSAVGGMSSSAMGNPFGVASAVTGVIGGAGSSALQIMGIEAKRKDIDNTPPQLVKMGSNTAYEYGNGFRGVYIIKKQIKPEYRKKLSHFFNMFGYKVNEVKIPNFHTRSKWNYVQTTSCFITGNFNNADLQELKSIFDNGITLWHTDDVGNYALENGVI